MLAMKVRVPSPTGVHSGRPRRRPPNRKMAVLIGSHAISARRRLLPAAAQRAVQLNQREQLVPSGLSQSQFGVEKIAIGIQGVQ